MKYVALLNKQVIDVIESNHTPQYPDTADGEKIQVVEIEDNLYPYNGLIYDDGIFLDMYTMAKVDISKPREYVEPTPEPTQADRIGANLDYLVLLNS